MFLINSTLFIVLLLSSYVLSTELEILFKNFQRKYQKTYDTSEEIELRKSIFNSNLLKIQKHNQRFEQGLETYTMGVNQFTDLTEEEFEAWLNGSLLQWPQIGTHEGSLKVLVGKIPERIDWREKDVVTTVKDQGNCGSCWAYSTTGSLEAQLALITGEVISLSEQELLDCSHSNWGCDGGFVQYAYDYIIANGLSSAENYPTTGSVGSCKSKSYKAVRMDNYYTITQYDESELKQAVGLIGPVSVSIYATPIQSYQGGIFKSSCSGTLNHAVLAVGYDKDNETGEEYWIIKNSWGTLWGESGYFRMSLGEGLCEVAALASFPLEVTTSLPMPNPTSSSNFISTKFCIEVFVIFALLYQICLI